MSTFSSYDSTVNSFYLAFYGRPADPAGMAYWSQQLANNNGDFGAIVGAFADSQEAQTRFGSNTVAERISDIYLQLFNRAPDTDGMAYWMSAIDKGHASLGDIAISILRGARGSDATLSQLRQQAADAFTAEVQASGSQYDGYASIEAARVLVRAVTSGATQQDLDLLVKSAVSFADTATKTPQVVNAIAVNTTLLALFDTPRGNGDPVALARALADTAKAAAGDPVTLESLLRGGGMDKVLKVMPAAATLKDVVKALADGGLPAAVEVVYPSAQAGAPADPPADVPGHVPPVGETNTVFLAIPAATSLNAATNVAGTFQLVSDGVSKTLTSTLIGTEEGLRISEIGAQQHVVTGTLQFTPERGAPVASTNAPGIVIDIGTNGRDTITGSVVWGHDGDDDITGTAGADNLFGGSGNDTIRGGAGSDTIHGGAGGDLIDLGNDNDADSVLYEPGEYTGPAFADGGSTAAIDKIMSFGLGDSLRIGSTFGEAPVIGNDYLSASSTRNDVALVRGSDADSVFVKGDSASDDDYMVQWMEGDVVNSVILHDFGATAPNLSAYAGGSRIEQVAPVTYLNTAFYLASNPSLATIVAANGYVNGMDASTFKLEAHSRGAQDAMEEYDALPGAETTHGGNNIHFKTTLSAGLYEMSWGDRTFTTSNGYLNAADVYFAGGQDGVFYHRGFALADAPTTVRGDVTRSNDANVNEGFVIGTEMPVRIHTGGGNDVVVDRGGSMTLVYDQINDKAQDLVLGFGRDDVIAFEGDAAAAIDTNHDGAISWAAAGTFPIAATDEGVTVTVAGAFSIGLTNAMWGQPNDTIVATLNNLLDISEVAKDKQLLILARSSFDDSSVLFVYQNLDDSGTIEAGELSTVAMFADVDSVLATTQIQVVGTQLDILTPP
jgi:hypothetical protein